MSKCLIHFIILQSSRFPRVFRFSALWLRMHSIRWQLKMVCSEGRHFLPPTMTLFYVSCIALLQHTAWRSELLLQSCVSKTGDDHWEWKRWSTYFSAEILAVKSEVEKLLQTDCMSQRNMFCISLCSCGKKTKNKWSEPSQKPTEIPAGTAQIQPGCCLDENSLTEKNLFGQVHQKELKRASEVRGNKWKSHPLIKVCWPLPHYFQISRNLTHF